ncbi:TRAP transporter substrate-binding protein DctP [Bacillus dakarensis]|uniref:TRAP transporter substrate-binding protein DctP n=1 Tax=Robertmurraya dakarensis TaxID=1926278 RepID=UPI0009812F38|nr:TRAP transporter substrate-binding protein DctP [Bacillus dakarensis]
MKKLLLFALLTSIFAIAGCGSSEDASGQSGQTQETITLKAATYFPNTSTMSTEVMIPWMEAITERTDGRVQFEYYPGEQIGKAADLMNLTKDGVTDLAISSISYTPDLFPISNALSGLPNLSETMRQGTMAYNDLLKESTELLETEYSKNNIRPLFGHVSPTFEIWSVDQELRVPDDFKGLKMRTPGGVLTEYYSYLGATPVSMPNSEAYEALEKGLVSAYSSYSLGVKSIGLQEILGHAVFAHIGTAVQPLVINEKKWQSLPEDVQQVIIEVSEEIMESASVSYEKLTDEFNQEFEANGGKIAQLTEEELKQWHTVNEAFTKEWLEEHKSDGFPYEEVLALYKEKLEEYK